MSRSGIQAIPPSGQGSSPGSDPASFKREDLYGRPDSPPDQETNKRDITSPSPLGHGNPTPDTVILTTNSSPLQTSLQETLKLTEELLNTKTTALTKAETELANLKLEQDIAKLKHDNALEEQKREHQTAIEKLKRQQQQALLAETEKLEQRIVTTESTNMALQNNLKTVVTARATQLTQAQTQTTTLTNNEVTRIRKEAKGKVTGGGITIGVSGSMLISNFVGVGLAIQAGGFASLTATTASTFGFGASIAGTLICIAFITLGSMDIHKFRKKMSTTRTALFNTLNSLIAAPEPVTTPPSPATLPTAQPLPQGQGQ